MLGLTGLLNNKTVLNSALGMIRNWMTKDSIAAVVISRTDDMTGDTPGLKIQAYTSHIGVVSGVYDNLAVEKFMKLREQYLKADTETEKRLIVGWIGNDLEKEAALSATGEIEKEVPDAI